MPSGVTEGYQSVIRRIDASSGQADADGDDAVEPGVARRAGGQQIAHQHAEQPARMHHDIEHVAAREFERNGETIAQVVFAARRHHGVHREDQRFGAGGDERDTVLVSLDFLRDANVHGNRGVRVIMG